MILEQVTRTLVARWRVRHAPLNSHRPVFLMHIPKTAGTSLIDLLANRFAADRCLVRVDRPSRQTLDVNQFDFVTGHVGFEFLERFRSEPNVITFLRHPVDRALSFYSFRRSFQPDQMREIYRREGEDPDSEWLAGRLRFCEQANRLSLRELLLQEPELAKKFFSNRQTRILAGDPAGNVESMFPRAMSNLQRCSFVGLTERFRESTDLLCRQLGWEPFAQIPRQNANRQRMQDSDLDEATRAALWKILEPDLALYAAAQNLFDQRLRAAADRDSIPAGQPQMSPLPDATNYSLRSPLFGAGWYRREKCGTTWSSWSGPGRESWLEFRPAAAVDSQFRCELFHPVSRQVLNSVQIRINDHRLTLRHGESQGRVVLEGNVPSQALGSRRDRLRVTFIVDELWRPCDFDSGTRDDRWLGINVAGLELAPVGLRVARRHQCSGAADVAS